MAKRTLEDIADDVGIIDLSELWLNLVGKEGDQGCDVLNMKRTPKACDVSEQLRMENKDSFVL